MINLLLSSLILSLFFETSLYDPVSRIDGNILVNNSSLNSLAIGFLLLVSNWYNPDSFINIAFGWIFLD